MTSDFIGELEKLEGMGQDANATGPTEEQGHRAYSRITDESEERYYDAIRKMQSPAPRTAPKGLSHWAERLYVSAYQFFSAIRVMAVPIILISEMAGAIGVWMSQKNKRSRRFFAYTLCIGIPALVLLAVFGYGSLAGIFY